MVVLLVGMGGVWAQEPEPKAESQPSQTRAKTYVPSPSSSDKVASGQIKILEVEYSSRRTDV
ncbi:MAG: hypothetical protein EBT75_07560, partial [Proteobacteria bacterium]|nr:hypothetical protein [Pseudomonadota bacterium]